MSTFAVNLVKRLKIPQLFSILLDRKFAQTPVLTHIVVYSCIIYYIYAYSLITA